MRACREGSNIWFWLFKQNKQYRRSFRNLIKSKYFWQDSFLTHINRFIGCKLFGHKITKLLDDNKHINFCFKCYSEVIKLKGLNMKY